MRHRDGRPRRRNQVGNVIKTNFFRQKQTDGFLVGAVQNGAGRAACLGRLLRQTEAGKSLPVRLQKGQGRAVQKVQRRCRVLPPLRVGHGVADGQSHIRRTQLGENGSVLKFHHGVNDALRMHHDGHLRQRQTVQPHGLDDLQPFVHQCGAVHGDLGAHGPVGVTQGVGPGHAPHLVPAHPPEGTAGAGQDQPPDLPTVGAAL